MRFELDRLKRACRDARKGGPPLEPQTTTPPGGAPDDRRAKLHVKADKLAKALKAVFETRLGYVRLAKRPADAQALASFCALYLDRDWLSRLLSTCKTSDAAPA